MYTLAVYLKTNYSSFIFILVLRLSQITQTLNCFQEPDDFSSILVWMNSPFCVEYIGESFKRKDEPQAQL